MGEENTPEVLVRLEDRWEEISQMIDDYLTKVGIKAKIPERVDEILNLSYAEIKGLTAEDCGENSFILSRYAIYIQQEYNYHKSKVDWCDLSLTFITANQGDPSTYMKKDEKAAKLASNNHAVRKLIKMMSTARTILTNLEGLSFKVSALSSSLESLQQTKRRMNYNG